MVIQYSNEHDYNDAEYGGYFSLETVSNLKRIFPDIDEKKWHEFAKGSFNNYGNPGRDWETRYSVLDPSTKVYGYDGFKIPVFEAEWIDRDITRRKYYKNRYGRQQVRDIEFGEKEKNARDVMVRIVRHCTWVVGTDYCYDWGVVKWHPARTTLSHSLHSM